MSERNLQVFSDAIAIAGGVTPTPEMGMAAEVLADDVRTLDGLAHRRIAGRISAPNFKDVTISRVLAGEMQLRRQGEPAAPAALSAAAESVRLQTYASFFGFSRESAISAAWDSLVMSVAELVSGAYRLERSMLVALLNSNPALADGTELFHADRGNIVASALSETSLGAAMSTLRSMPGADGNALQTEPALLCIPSTIEVSTRKMLRESDVSLVLFVDSRLTHSVLMPDPRQTPCLALMHLEGADVPRTKVGRLQSNDTWPISASHDVAVAAVGERCVRIGT